MEHWEDSKAQMEEALLVSVKELGKKLAGIKLKSGVMSESTTPY